MYKEQVGEVFVDFLEVERITGRVLGEAILNWLKSHNIPSADMRGQYYDGASKMRGARSGVKAVVQEAAPKAMYYHRAAHCLNLAVVSACSIQAYKKAESYIGEIARFFKYSAKRQRLLDRCIEACDTTPNAIVRHAGLRGLTLTQFSSSYCTPHLFGSYGSPRVA